MGFVEHYKRSIAKTITYRILIIIATYILFYTMLHDSKAALENSLVWNLIGMILYFLHERVWNLTHWGKHSSASSRRS